MMGEEVFIRAGIAAKGAGFSLCHKPRAGAGIEGLARFISNDGRGSQMVALDIGQGDGRDTGHQILQMHQQLQTLRRIAGDHLLKLLITREKRSRSPQDVIIFSQDRFRVIHRQVMGEVTVNLMIVVQKIFTLSPYNKHRDQHKTEQDARKAHHNGSCKRKLSVLKRHQ